jgi:hypothetical protein
MTDMKEIHNDFMIIPVLAFSLKIKGDRRHNIGVPYGMYSTLLYLNVNLYLSLIFPFLNYLTSLQPYGMV